MARSYIRAGRLSITPLRELGSGHARLVTTITMVNFDIVLVNTRNYGVTQIYRPGSVVEGHVAIELSSPQNIKGISIVISGKARVKWEAGASTHPSNTEIVLGDTSSQLLGNGRDSQRLAAGRHQLPFSFRLPIGLPQYILLRQ